MTTERNLGDVLDQILAAIPQGEEGQNLRTDLKKIGSSFGYSSPEALGRDWGRVFGAIAANIPISTTPTKNLVPWQRKVMLIWMDMVDLDFEKMIHRELKSIFESGQQKHTWAKDPLEMEFARGWRDAAAALITSIAQHKGITFHEAMLLGEKP